MTSKLLWKRFLVVTLAATMGASAMVGASENESGDNTVSAVEYDPLGKYDETVSFTLGSALLDYTTDLSDGGTPEDNAYKDYIKDVLNVEYEYELESYDSNDYATQLSLAITSGELPDVMYITDLNVLYELVENDMIEDLTDAYNNYASDLQRAMYESFDQDMFAKVTFDGKIMALPRCGTEPENMIWIRQDWLDKLGIQIDEDGDKLITREELEMVAREFVENDPGQTGNPVGITVTSILGKDATSSSAVVNSSFGAHYRYWFQAEDGSVYNGSTVPEMKDALTWWTKMYSEGLLDPQYGVRDWDGGVETLLNEQSGIYFGEVTAPLWYCTALYETNPEAAFTAFALDDGTGKTVTAHYDVTNRYIVVRKGYEHPEVVVKLENLFRSVINDPNLKETNPDLYDYYQTGLFYDIDPLRLAANGADYVTSTYDAAQQYLAGEITKEDVTEPNKVTLIEILDKYAKDPGSLSVSEQATYEYYMNGVSVLTSLQEQGLLEYVTPLQVPSTATMSSKQADLDKLEEETYVNIITGEASVDEFENFVEEWNVRGGAQIAEEIAELLQ